MLKLPKKNQVQQFQIDSTKSLTRCGPETYENKTGRLNGIGTLPSPLHPGCVGIGLVGCVADAPVCMCERGGAGSQALSLLSDSIFWEHQSAYTVTMQLNTIRSNAADIQNAQNHTHDTHIHTCWPRHPADRALCPPSIRRVHAQTYLSSTACYPSSVCTWRRSCSQ